MAATDSAELYGAVCAFLRADAWLGAVGLPPSAPLTEALQRLRWDLEAGAGSLDPQAFQDLVMQADEQPAPDELRDLRDIFLGAISNLFSKDNFQNPRTVKRILREDVLDLYRTYVMDAQLTEEGDDVFVHSAAADRKIQRSELVSTEKALQKEDLARYQGLPK